MGDKKQSAEEWLKTQGTFIGQNFWHGESVVPLSEARTYGQKCRDEERERIEVLLDKHMPCRQDCTYKTSTDDLCPPCKFHREMFSKPAPMQLNNAKAEERGEG